MKEAAKLHDELSAMDKQVPYLSPAEQKWLDGELNSGNGKITDRYIRATDSQEYAVSTAKSGFALVLIPLNHLSSLKMACKDEVLMWTEVASRLPDTQLWQAVDHLVERKIVSPMRLAKLQIFDFQCCCFRPTQTTACQKTRATAQGFPREFR
jgi:hypothetical protein